MKASVYLRPSWKMWPISMPRADTSGPAPSGDGSPSRTSAASMVPSAMKSRPATRPTTCLPGSSAPVIHDVPVHHPGIDEISNTVGQQRFRADVTLDQEWVLGEVRVVEQGVLGGIERGAEPLLVDLAVTRHTDRQQLPFAAGLDGP